MYLMTVEFLIYWAGFVLGMIFIANFFAPKKLNYAGNINRMENFHRQVFCVHCGYTALTLAAMALVCVFYNAELVNAERGGLAWAGCLFMAVFWGSRVVVQVVYYDKAIKKTYPVFNIMFFIAFAYLAVIFTFLTIK